MGSGRREQERALPMEELVRVRVPSVRLQREVRQQFEQITNAVFDRLEPYLKHAFRTPGTPLGRLRQPAGRRGRREAAADAEWLRAEDFTAPRRHAFARFANLTHLSLSKCRTSDGSRTTALDVPDALVEIA
ncbi:hypothetical protein ACF1FX_26565 [Streptomyces sp. NPDC014646]|uniref:NACHT N-terminal Helical domain 1-containing protein n=1 Tax=unclassified Streptomyces TaxID=2593676 RepID=UPI0036F93F54